MSVGGVHCAGEVGSGVGTRWLADPVGLGIDLDGADLPPVSPSSHAFHDAATTPVVECGEPLVDAARHLLCHRVYESLSIASLPPRLWLRASLVRRLRLAQPRLPAGFSLALLDGWRSPRFQSDLLAYYRSTANTQLDGFVADPADARLVAPHTTGGAVDLTLAYRGIPLALGTDFDDFTELAAPAALEASIDPAGRLTRDLRRLLAGVLRPLGLVALPTEWWHWSFGDQQWAVASAAPRAIYGSTEPGAGRATFEERVGIAY
jgi:D-alanyl-D-alanine dipeptidase